jgi:thioredoxin reductase (NADPH)
LLGVPGEDLLRGKGVFECALCDGGQYAGKVVAVCGGGDSALTEALYMAKIASKVIVIHRRKQLRSTGILSTRAMADPKIEFVLDGVVESIGGSSRVESVRVRNVETGQMKEIKTDGVLVQVGMEPNTGYLNGVVRLDSQGQIVADGNMQTDVPYVLAAGDIRSGSPRQIAAAVGDGSIAGITAQRLLDELG